MPIIHPRDSFPEGFLFGTSTSAHQIEGSGFGGCGPSHWDTFAATPGNIARSEHARRACGHYQHWAEDLDLLKAGGFDGYRFSVAWPRVLPDGIGAVNPDGLDFYDRLVDGLLERDIKPTAMLYHWDLPAALADRGGWTNPQIADWFADYATVVMDRLGDRLYGAATLNEPWCVAWLSHFLGHHAPGLRDIRAAVRAMHHVLVAHGLGVQAIRASGVDNIGLALNFEYAEALNDSAAAAAATRLYDGIYNRWFAGAIGRGAYPEDVLAVFEPHMPANFADDFATITAPVDWLGINYYTRKLIAPGPSGLVTDMAEHTGGLPQTTMGWEIYPDGLRYHLTRLHRDFTGDLPLIVTENGLSAPDAVENGRIEDNGRIDYLNQHLGAVKQAIAEGAPVEGYYVWSLMDNFEWALGYDKRFGLIHVDFDTLARTPKQSYAALKAVLAP